MSAKRRLQVFVSSTYNDLKDERQAAVAAILKAGHIPAGMELFTAGDESQMTIIKRWIDESDVYMLILGGRYGSIEPASGISYTELEFNYAVETGKALFSVVETDASLDKRVKIHGRAILEENHPEKLRNFRSKVLNNISSFFEDAKDIKLSVHESLSDFAGNRDLKGWISAGEVQDTAPLIDQIERLSGENESLRKKIFALEQQKSASVKEANSAFEELRKILINTDVTVPAYLTSESKEQDVDLFSIFVSCRDSFLTGFTNQVGMSKSENFLYYTVSPLLKIHGLVDSEKVAGAKYRRMFATKEGIAFLEQQARRVAQKKMRDATSEQSPVASAEVLAEDNAPAKRKTPARKRSVN